MDNDRQINEWRQDARKWLPGVHGYIDVGTGLTAWFRRDRIGRARRMTGEQDDGLGLLIPPGWRRRFPHPPYAYGYERAVAYEYELLTGDLFVKPRAWLENAKALASGLTVQDGPYGDYGLWVRHCQDIAKSVKEERPSLLKVLEPIAYRHGLDVVPWGMGWLLKHFVEVQPAYGLDPGPAKGPPRGQRDPATDALLLYLHLAGYLGDARAKAIIKPVIDLGLVRYPERRVQQIKKALGVRRKPGRPSGRTRQSAEAKDEVYGLLRNQVRYLTRHGLTRS